MYKSDKCTCFLVKKKKRSTYNFIDAEIDIKRIIISCMIYHEFRYICHLKKIHLKILKITF